MRVTIFTECYEPVITGVVHSIESTKKGLEELGHEVFIITPNYGKKNLKDEKIIPCPSIPLGSTGYHFVYGFPERARKIAESSDILHTHHPFTLGQRARKIAEKQNQPLLFTHHTQYDQYVAYVPFVKKLAKKVLYGYLRSFCNKVTLIIAPSESIKRKIKGYGSQTPIEAVPNGVEIREFQKDNIAIPPELKEIPADEKVIIFVGRVCYEKNIDFVIRSFKKVVEQMPKSRFLIVGGGPAFDEFKKLTEDLGIARNVTMTGAVPFIKIPGYFKKADIFVSASKTEVHPMVGIEAMASGLPIVSLDSVGYRDIVKNKKTGLLAQENFNDFSAKIIELISDDEKLKRMSKNASHESKQYSIAATAKKMLKIYQLALELKKASKTG